MFCSVYFFRIISYKRILEQWEVEEDVRSLWPLLAGLNMCYKGNHKNIQRVVVCNKVEKLPGTDLFLELETMKKESPVIADQHAAVNTFPGLVHTARHTMGAGSARSS